MAHKVQTVVGNVTLPGVGQVETAGTIVTLDDDDFQKIPASAFPSKLTDLGVTTGAVSAQANYVAAVGALTSSQEATANGSDLATTQALANSLKTKYNALQTDVATLRTALNAALSALQTAGGPMKSS